MNSKEIVYDKYISRYLDYMFKNRDNTDKEKISDKKLGDLVKEYEDWLKQKYSFIFSNFLNTDSIPLAYYETNNDIEDYCAFYSQNNEKLLTPSMMKDKREADKVALMLETLGENDRKIPLARIKKEKEEAKYCEKSEKEIIDNIIKRACLIINTGEVPDYNAKYGKPDDNNYAYNKPVDYYLSNNNNLFNLTLNLSKAKEYKEFIETIEINDVVFSILREAETDFVRKLSDKIYYALHHITKKQEMVEKRYLELEEINKTKDLTELYDSLFLIKAFLDSGLTKEKFCQKNAIAYTYFDNAIHSIEKNDPETFKTVQNKLRGASMGLLNMMNTIKACFKDYRPNISDLSVLDYCALTSKPITEVINFFRGHNDFSTANKLNSFYKANLNGFKPINYPQLYSGKTIVKGREITKDDITNIKNIIDKNGYPQINGIYLKVRAAYLEDRIFDISKENVKEKLKNERDLSSILDDSNTEEEINVNNKTM